MRISKYNVVEIYDELILLYNSYSGKLIYIKWEQNIYDVLCGNISIDFLDDFIAEKLLKFGFLIEDETDEDKLVELKKLDFIYSNTLKLEIIPTLLCNFRCPYCYEEHEGIIISEKVIKHIKLFFSKHIGNYSSVEIFWFGGEPLLAKEAVISISSYVKELALKCNKKFFFSITTNGYFLEPKTFDELYHVGIRSYNITLDGTKNYHDKTRYTKNGEGSYDKIIDNLKQIHAKSGFFQINLRCNITKNNNIAINEFKTEMNKLFSNDYRFKIYFRPVGDWGGKTVKSIKNTLLEDTQDIYRSLFINSIDNFMINFDYQFLWSGNNNLCEASQRNYFVFNYNGDILKCTKHLYDKLNIIGKIAENGDLILDKMKLANWILPKDNKHIKCLECKSYANCFSLQCPIDCHQTCDCSEFLLKQQLKLQYIFNHKNFIKI